MSTFKHPFWPAEGSVWSHWSDALVVSQLAACRAGFTGLGRCYRSTEANQLRFRCSIQATQRREKGCSHHLLTVRPKYRGDTCVVSWLGTKRLRSGAHHRHVGGVGTSGWLQNSPTQPLALAVGDRVVGFRQLHTLEGALRASARREGRYLAARSSSSASGERLTYSLCCVLGTSKCTFVVRLREMERNGWQERWQCVQIRGEHSCISEAPPISHILRSRLGFYPPISLVDGAEGQLPTLLEAKEPKERDTLTDRQWGFFPVVPGVPPPPPSPAPTPPAMPTPPPTRPTPPPGRPSSPGVSSSSSSFSPRVQKARSNLSTAIVALSVATDKVTSLVTEVESPQKRVEEEGRRVRKEELARSNLIEMGFSFSTSPQLSTTSLSTLSSLTADLEEHISQLNDAVAHRKLSHSKERRARKKLMKLLEGDKEKRMLASR